MTAPYRGIEGPSVQEISLMDGTERLLASGSAALHVLLEGLRLGNVSLLGLGSIRIEKGRLRIPSVRLGLCKFKQS